MSEISDTLFTHNPPNYCTSSTDGVTVEYPLRIVIQGDYVLLQVIFVCVSIIERSHPSRVGIGTGT